MDTAASRIRRLVLPLSVAAAVGGPVAAQPDAAWKMPRIVEPPACESGDLDITVCGRRVPNERYRIPPELREDRTNPVNPSWSARMRDEREAARYEEQAVGPGGAFKHSAEVVCRWRSERQQIAGHPPDCTRRVRAPGN